MSDTSSDMQIFLILCVLLMVAAPLVSWSVIPERRENSSRLWFFGAVLLAVMSIIFYLDQSAVTAFYVPNVGAALCAVAALRLERRPGPAHWRTLFSIMTAIGMAHEVAHQSAMSGLISNAWVLGTRVLLVTVLDLVILIQAVGLARVHRSRGMALVAVGIAPLVVINGTRVLGVALGSNQMGPQVDAAVFPILAMVLTFAAVTYNFGFLAYALEKSHARSLRAQEQAARAEERASAALAYNDELQRLIAQRDEMLMNSTRLSAVSAIGLYNSAIVHEISQPLQALRSTLDGLRLRAQRASLDRSSGLRAGLDQACDLNRKISDLVQSLRGLIATRPTVADLMALHHAIRSVSPVLSGECHRRGITLILDLSPQLEAAQVRADPLLLQRMLMNLVANSIDALSRLPDGQKEVRIQTQEARLHGRSAVLLRVQDNGPGFPESLMESNASPLTTNKLGGAGIGLTLTRLVMDAWKGAVELGAGENPKTLLGGTPQPRPGATVSLYMPLAP